MLLHAQSADIAQGVDSAGNKDEGAGDQGIMFGYACDETPELMPAPIYYAHRILENLAKARKTRANGGASLGPDAKSQVTVRYENGKPVGGRPRSCVSTQHVEHRDGRELTSERRARRSSSPMSARRCRRAGSRTETVWHVNPTGKFVIGGPDGDCGLTGRKIIVDTYGGAAPHGGGAFSGKDPTKVDRSAAYAARYLAKNVVAAGLAGRCTIQLSYAIGVAKPLSIYADLHGTGQVDEGRLENALMEVMDLSPRGIRTHLDLNKPIYAKTSVLRPFRPGAAERRRLLVGAHRPGAGRSSRPSPETAAGERRARREPRLLRPAQGQAPARRPGRPRPHPPAGPAGRSGRRLRGLRSRSFEGLALEIGFGGGEHLARAGPAASDDRLRRLRAVRERHGEAPRRRRRGGARQYPPVGRRRHGAPAAAARGARSAASSMLYPDPWPKRRQRKRRLSSRTSSCGCSPGSCGPGAELRFATDIDDYAGWALARVLRSGAISAGRPRGADDWRKPWPDWPGTRYEAKALREGRVPSYLTFERR